MCEPMSRRGFLGTAAGIAAAGAAGLGGLRAGEAAGPGAAGPLAAPGGAVKIHKLYLAKPVPTWPKPDLDIPAEIAKLEGHLAAAKREVQGVEFVGGELLRVSADADKVLPAVAGADGLLLFNITSGVGGLIGRFADTGKPAVLFSQPYSGHDWSIIAALQKAGKKICCFATSDYGELAAAARLLGTGPRLRASRIVYVTEGGMSAEAAKKIQGATGVGIVSLNRNGLQEIYEKIDPKAAEAEAEEWIRGAAKVVEPSRDEIVKSSRMYLAMRKAMEDARAQAITIDCLGLFYRKLLPAYPCLGHCRLCDQGLVGACEADVDSTLTMLIFGYAFGVPGFISDPVVDTATNTVIHAHCVSPTRLDGPGKAAAPYIIRSHMEDDKGASLQVKMRVGQPITCAKLITYDTMLVSTGKILDNPDVDRGCRTKITTEVRDAHRFLGGYAGGLHRVIFYGDRLAGVKDLAFLLGWKVVEEV